MDYFRRFTFLFAAPVFDTDDLEGLRFNQIITEIERSGFEVVRARKLEDAEIAVQTDAAIGCMVVDWGKKGLEGKTAALINLMCLPGVSPWGCKIYRLTHPALLRPSRPTSSSQASRRPPKSTS